MIFIAGGLLSCSLQYQTWRLSPHFFSHIFPIFIYCTTFFTFFTFSHFLSHFKIFFSHFKIFFIFLTFFHIYSHIPHIFSILDVCTFFFLIPSFFKEKNVKQNKLFSPLPSHPLQPQSIFPGPTLPPLAGSGSQNPVSRQAATILLLLVALLLLLRRETVKETMNRGEF